MRNTRYLAAVMALGLACAASFPAPASAAEIPVATAPAVLQGEPPATALPAHARRIGGVAFDKQVMQPPGEAHAGEGEAWLIPQLHFELFPDVSFDAQGARIEQDDFGNTTWVGEIEGVEDGIVILTTNGDAVAGRADIGLSQYLLNGSATTGVWVTEIDPATYRGMGDYAGVEKFLSGLAAPAKVTARPMGGMSPLGASAGHTVDLLVLYSDNAWLRMGALNMSSTVATLVADMNQSFVNSSVDAEVRVVGYEKVPGYAEPTVSGYPAAWNTQLLIRNAMRDGTGYFSGVPSARDTYHADVAIMFVDGTKIEGPCGVADILPDLDGSDDDNIYDVVLSTECAIGDRTFTHETGHVMAGMHDTAIGYRPTYPLRSNYGYSSPSPAFHTIMAENDAVGGPCNTVDGCPRINRWSSLTQTYLGVPLGTTVVKAGITYTTDMVSALVTTVPLVAAYRSPSGLTVPGTPGTPTFWECAGYTRLVWGPASGVAGWYEAEASSSSSGPFSTIYKGAALTFSKHFSTSKVVQVKACNANGCGSHSQVSVPPTGSGCVLPP